MANLNVAVANPSRVAYYPLIWKGAMNQGYMETYYGEILRRSAPGPRHELICARLHQCVHASVANLTSTKLLLPREAVLLSPDNEVCPDLALVTVPNGKLWLAAEIVSSDDHRADTVLKKQLYEEQKVARVWMIDPRYDNVEVYRSSQYGLILKHILANREILTEKLLPEFQMTVGDLFASE